MVHSKTYTAIREVPIGRKMEYVLYKITSPSGRMYIGITNNLKRRLKEHKTSPYPFGHAVRKYGYENMHFEFELFKDVSSALAREAELVTPAEVASRKFYNSCVGGTLSNVLSQDNPMHRKSVVENHPNIWTTENNPMRNPDSRDRMIRSQACKRVSVDGVEYYGVREAARKTGQSRQNVVNRLRSKNFPTWYYL